LAWDGEFLWNADYSTALIFCLDPQTAQPIRGLPCPGTLSGLAWDGRSLWQVMHGEGHIRRINPESGDIDHTLLLEDQGWLSGVAWDGVSLWVVSQQKGVLFALDPESGQIKRTLPAPVAAGGLTWHDGSLWLAYPYSMAFSEEYDAFEWQGEERRYALARLEPASGAELDRTELDFLPLGLAWVKGDLWLSHAGAFRLYRASLDED
jgi:hypothetical protein